MHYFKEVIDPWLDQLLAFMPEEDRKENAIRRRKRCSRRLEVLSGCGRGVAGEPSVSGL